MPFLVTLVPESFVYILEPEHLNFLYQQKFFIPLSFPCTWSCEFSRLLCFDILTSLPLLLNMICILLELSDMLKAGFLFMFLYMFKMSTVSVFSSVKVFFYE